MDILGLIGKPDKMKFTFKILELFEAGKISIDFANEMIRISVSPIP